MSNLITFSPNTDCKCDVSSTEDGSTKCDANGQCNCTELAGGKKCDECKNGYYGDPKTECSPCSCDKDWFIPTCNKTDGTCVCAWGRQGDNCEKCIAGYYKAEDDQCLECKCDVVGSQGPR